MNEPLDDLHAECLQVRARVRAAYLVVRIHAACWQPRPCPPPKPVVPRRQPPWLGL